MASLDEVRLKIDRANKNIEHIKQFLPGRGTPIKPSDFLALKRQSDGKTTDVFVTRVEPAMEFRLGIGDVMHDLRTALDYLVYQLAIHRGFPTTGRTTSHLREMRKLCFLIHSDEGRFRSAAGNVKKIIGDDPVAAMETLQSYKGLDPRGPILWKLSELDNITKHRMIATIYPELEHAEVTFSTETETFAGTLRNPERTPLKDGAKLFSFQWEGIEPPKMDVNIKAVQKVVFAESDGLCDGENVFHVMRDSVDAVRAIVDDFARFFV